LKSENDRYELTGRGRKFHSRIAKGMIISQEVLKG